MVGTLGASENLRWLIVPAGACIGSFLATVAWRLPRGISTVSPRSACDRCATPLTARDLVPMLSWSVQRGKCRHCGAAIDPLYPLVELGATVVAVWSVSAFTGWYIFASCVLGWSLITLSAIDLRHRILPDRLVLPLIGAGLVVAWIDPTTDITANLAAAAAGYLVFLAVSLLYRGIRGREGLGLGDAKLLAAAGAWLGWIALPSVVLIASAAALCGTIAMGTARGDSLARTTEISFGPYLALSFWLCWLYEPIDLIL